jgi:formate dehydrogenase major subunit
MAKLDDMLKRRAQSKDPLSLNWWQNEPKYVVSLLKSFFGDKASAENEFGYPWMPKLDEGKPYSWLDIFDEMFKGSIKGFFAWGMNPACSGSNAGKVRKALANLEWMVNVNLFDNETGSFWHAAFPTAGAGCSGGMQAPSLLGTAYRMATS